MYDLLVRTAAEGAVPLIGQNVLPVVKITGRARVLRQGRPVLPGPGSELADNPRVAATRLGALAEPPGQTFKHEP